MPPSNNERPTIEFVPSVGDPRSEAPKFESALLRRNSIETPKNTTVAGALMLLMRRWSTPPRVFKLTKTMIFGFAGLSLFGFNGFVFSKSTMFIAGVDASAPTDVFAIGLLVVVTLALLVDFSVVKESLTNFRENRDALIDIVNNPNIAQFIRDDVAKKIIES
jgi:hypothetical protein